MRVDLVKHPLHLVVKPASDHGTETYQQTPCLLDYATAGLDMIEAGFVGLEHKSISPLRRKPIHLKIRALFAG
ncbi:hypothetical protein KEM48_001242 [Puccinia striiformis f. sp. tritici PST-130]|nr:hypothetical protein KEM48_001242 [Puccinia striiformis f. sp. tritici PST-130]